MEGSALQKYQFAPAVTQLSFPHPDAMTCEERLYALSDTSAEQMLLKDKLDFE